MTAALVLFGLLGLLLGLRFRLRELIAALVLSGLLVALVLALQGRGVLPVVASVAGVLVVIEVGFFIALFATSQYRAFTAQRGRRHRDAASEPTPVEGEPLDRPHDNRAEL